MPWSVGVMVMKWSPLLLTGAIVVSVVAKNLFLRDNPTMGPMIRATSLRGFVDLIEELGGRPDELLARFGISPSVLHDDDGVLPITAHDQMLDVAAHELACPDFGLRLAEAQDLSILGPLAVAIAMSPTAGEALDCASRFLFVHSPALQIGIEDDPLGRRGVVALAYRKDLSESNYSPQGTELGLGVFFRVAVSLIGEAQSLRSVLIPHQPLSRVRRYLGYFGTDVRFGGSVAALCVDRRVLDEGFADANQSIRAVAVEHLSRQFRDPRLDLSARVRLGVAETLRTSSPTIGDVARLFSLGPRTLQRRLLAEGTTFAEILDEVRKEAAHRYLTTTTLPIGQIAHLVGFSEQSTLSHATQRWYRASPRQLRQRAVVGPSR
jgi:AraC-like DNA-binding protein